MDRYVRVIMLAVTAVAVIASTTVAHAQRQGHPTTSAVALSAPSPSAGMNASPTAAAVAAWHDAPLDATPTPTPIPTPAGPVIPHYAPGTVQAIIVQAFTPYGSTAVAWGLRVGRCESGYNARAYNAAGPYYGVFQFLMSTFKATPYGGGDIYDPVANSNAAAWKWSRGGANAWGCK